MLPFWTAGMLPFGSWSSESVSAARKGPAGGRGLRVALPRPLAGLVSKTPPSNTGVNTHNVKSHQGGKP